MVGEWGLRPGVGGDCDSAEAKRDEYCCGGDADGTAVALVGCGGVLLGGAEVGECSFLAG